METCAKYEAYSEPVVNRNWLIRRLLEMPEEIEQAESDMLKLTDHLELVKRKLMMKEMTLVLNGKVEGKNEGERKAHLLNLTMTEREQVQKAETDLAAYKIQFNRKLNEFSALRAVARLISKEAE